MLHTFALAIFLSMTNSQAIEKFTSETATEAQLSFEGRIELAKGERSRDRIDQQLQHLIGHFSSASFVKSFGQPAVLSDQYEFTITNTKKLSNGRRLVTYQFDGKAAIHKKSFGTKSLISVPLRLPLALDKIYQLGVVRGKNKCTDEHYNDPGDFFYFWDVDQRGCPLKGNDTDVVRVTAQAKRLPNTKKSYPEFDRLYSKDDLNISLFVGYIEDEPGSAEDDGTIIFNDLKNEMIEREFKLVSEKQKGLSHFAT